MRPAHLVAAAALVFAVQEPRAPIVFRASTDLVHLDVSVFDKDRRPVRGLTAADFSVFEDDLPQAISAFAAVDVPATAVERTRWMRAVAPDVQSNALTDSPEGRLIVILLDDAMIPDDPLALSSARSVAKGVVDRISPIDQVAVVFSLNSANTQGFTHDRAKLLTAINNLGPGNAHYTLGWDTAVQFLPLNPAAKAPWHPAGDPDIPYRTASLQTLRSIAQTLIGAPQRRKALFYVSPGVTADTATAGLTIRIDPNQDGQSMAVFEANQQLVREMPELYRRMQRANVTIYPIDPFGLNGLSSYIQRVTAGLHALSGGMPPPLDYNWLIPGLSPPPIQASIASHFVQIHRDYLQTAASNTGGVALMDTNEFNSGLDRIFEENSSYYLLGYVQPDKNKAGSLHRLSVKVNRQGVTARARNSYEVAKSEKDSKKKDEIDTLLNASTAGPVATGGLLMRVAAGSIAVAASQEAAVMITLGFEEPDVTSRTPQTIDFQGGLYTPDGSQIGAAPRYSAAFALLPGASATAKYDVITRLSAPPGRYQLRISAHRSSDGLTGSVYTDVEVPDFSKAPLSVSGLFVEAASGASAVGREAIAGIVPMVPTTRRAYAPQERVTIFMRLYQGGQAPLWPVAVAMRLRDGQDKVVTSSLEQITSFDAGTRAADYKRTLGLTTLAPGDYLLSFDVGLGLTLVTRSITFTVR